MRPNWVLFVTKRTHLHATIPLVQASAERVYLREEVRRVLALTERTLAQWETEELIPRREQYTFPDLVALRTLIRLREDKLPTRRIRAVLEALRVKLTDVHDPLTELKITTDGKQVQVYVAGQPMEALSGQLLLHFDAPEMKKLLAFPGREQQEKKESQRQRLEAESLFQQGVALEQQGGPIADVIRYYERAAVLDPAAAGALVNLGTIYFHARKWREAEKYYQQALRANPEYALAQFNLGNLFDERGERAKAKVHYEEAIRINPRYGDAHYNLALLYQLEGQTLKAVNHWQMFLKLDPTGSWAEIARQELSKLRQATVVVGQKQRATS